MHANALSFNRFHNAATRNIRRLTGRQTFIAREIDVARDTVYAMHSRNTEGISLRDIGSAESLEERAYIAIREMILTGELVAGQKLVQEDLAARLGVSRTPLRSAIASLERDSLVKFGLRGEAFVPEFGPSQIAGVFEIRAVLEGLTCRLLAPSIERKHTVYLRSLMMAVADTMDGGDYSEYRQADVEFHTYLTNLVKDSMLMRMLDSLQIIMSMSLAQGLLRSPQETLPEHIAIIDALEAHDPDAAEKAMISHIRRTITLIEQRK